MNTEAHLKKLRLLQTAITESLHEPHNSYTYNITRPKLIRELGQAVEEAKKVGVTDNDLEELVLELEVTTGTRPINLEYFWNPLRISKGWKAKHHS